MTTGKDEAMTRWVSIKDFPDYEISDTGKLRNINDRRKHLKQFRDNKGYFRIHIRNKKKSLNIGTHRLVLMSFVGKPPKGMCAAHLNGKSGDNRLSNLKWATHKENESHKLIHGTRANGSKHGNSALTEKQVRYIKKHAVTRDIGIKSNTSKLAKRFGVTRRNIGMILRGKSWFHVNV